MRIAIVGNPGSGKSTLAAQLHAITKVPVYHLDQYYWKPKWQRPDQDAFATAHHALCDKEEWIIEGVATRILEYRIQRADIVIFFDMPTIVCLYRLFRRAFLGFGKEGFASPKGCPEGVPSWEIIRFIWRFNRDKKPIILNLLQIYKQKHIFVIKSNAELCKTINYFQKIYNQV